MRRKVFHPKTTTNGGHWSTGMGDINRSSPDGVRGLDDNYDKVEQEVFAKHYLPGRWWWWLSYKKWN